MSEIRVEIYRGVGDAADPAGNPNYRTVYLGAGSINRCINVTHEMAMTGGKLVTASRNRLVVSYKQLLRVGRGEVQISLADNEHVVYVFTKIDSSDNSPLDQLTRMMYRYGRTYTGFASEAMVDLVDKILQEISAGPS